MAQELRRITTFVGATGRALRFQLRDATGVVIDLSGYTSAAISGKLDTTEKIQNEAVTIEAGTDGWVSFTPSSGAIDTEGEIRAQIKLIAAANDYTDEFVIEVLAVHDYTA